MVTRAIGGVERDYLLIAYKGADKLYVPTDQIDTVRQYIGGEAPAVNKLGGADFARTKSRVASAVRAIAQELVVLYQKRVNAVGHAYGGDTPWQREMEERFPYLETRDQLRAIGDVLRDQLFYMQRVGFNAFATRPDRSIEDALKGLTDFSDTYQTSWDQKTPLFRRVPRPAAEETR
jgi:transcription-repair coupling factor (superfamily II helicase)